VGYVCFYGRPWVVDDVALNGHDSSFVDFEDSLVEEGNLG
jgi:hypothetical protein